VIVNDNPRVLIVGNFLSSYGFSRGVCEELAPRLRAAGWSVLTVSNRKWKLARLADMVSSTWLLRHRYDVAQVDVYSGPAFLWAEAVCAVLRQLGRPYVLTLHGGRLPEFSAVNEKRVRGLLGSAAAVTVPSRYLLERMSGYRSSLTLLPNGLELSNYPFRRRRPLQPKIVWLRAFHEIYNPSMAVRAVARLKDQFPGLRLIMTGADKGDASKEQTLAAAKDLGVQDLVQMNGPVPKANVPQSLESGDIFINTSSIDNTPVSVLEAMAAGLCVVSTDAGGMPYLLRSGHTGLLVPRDDDKAMAGAIRQLLEDQELADQIQLGARAQVAAFDWSAVLSQWQRLFASVARGETVRAGALDSAPIS